MNDSPRGIRIAGFRVLFLKTLFALCLFAVGFSAGASGPAAAPKGEKRVLLIYSYQISFAPDFQFVDAFNRELSRTGIKFRAKHLELGVLTPNAASREMLEQKIAPCLPEIRNGSYDVIIPLGQIAIDLLLTHAAEIPDRTAVIYCGLDVAARDLYQRHSNTTGAFGRVSVSDNIDLALKLFPRTKKVILLADWSIAGQRIADDGKRQRTSYPQLEIVIPENASIQLNQMLDLVRNQSSDTVILFYSWFNIDSTNLASLEYILSHLEHARARMFALQEPMFRQGAVGGVFVSVDLVGKSLAESVNRVFLGEKACDIPAASIPLKTCIGWSAIETHQISKDRVPPFAEISGEPRFFRPEQIPWAVACCVLFALIAAALAVTLLILLSWRARNRKTMRELEEIRRQETELTHILQAVFDISPIGISVKDADSGFKFVMCNRAFSEMVERPIPDILGKDDFELAFSNFNANVCVGQDKQVVRTGINVDVTEQTHKGFPDNQAFRVMKMPIFMKDKRLVLGLFMDITGHINLEAEQARLLYEKGDLLDNARIVSDCLREAVVEVDFARSVRKILARIGRKFGAAHCDIFRFTDEYSGIECLYSWCRGEEDEISGPRRYPTSICPTLMETLKETGTIYIDDLGRIPPEFAGIRPLVSKFHFSSMAVQDIQIDSHLAGFLKIDFIGPQHKFTENDSRLLCEAVNLYGLIRTRSLRMQEIAEQNHMEKQIFDNLTMPILLLNSSKTIILANAKSREVFGDDLAGRKICDCVCKLNESLHCTPETCSFQGIINGNVPFIRTVPIRGRTYQLRGQPVLNLEGRLVSMLAVYVDVTDLNKALEAAQAADKAKSFFMASVSHEIRTPLNSVIGFSELLKSDSLSREERNDYLDSIRISGNALLQLIGDVLDLSRLEAGQMTVNPASLDFNALCGEVLQLFQPDAKTKGIVLRHESELLPALVLDEQRMRQILWNLLGNAIKFTQHGSVSLKTAFTPGPSGAGILRISISDTGCGIPKGDIEKLYQPFVRLSRMRGTGSGKSGTGLGLAVTRRMIECMGGSLSVESEVGKGSTFRIVFPGVFFRRNPSAPNRAELPAPARILVVDDVPMNLKVLSGMLGKLGIEVATASGGTEALEKMSSVSFDMVLTDLWMPDMNGEQLARAIRAKAPAAVLRIAAVTADSDASSNFALDVFDAVLQKPVTLDKLRKLIDRHV